MPPKARRNSEQLTLVDLNLETKRLIGESVPGFGRGRFSVLVGKESAMNKLYLVVALICCFLVVAEIHSHSYKMAFGKYKGSDRLGSAAFAVCTTYLFWFLT